MFKASKKYFPITPNANPKDYHALGGEFERGNPLRVMSRIELWKFRKCPSKWISGVAEKKTDALDFGSLVDCLFLMPERFATDYVIQPDEYGPGKKWTYAANKCKEWRAAQGTKEITTLADVEAARFAVNRLHGHRYISAYVKPCLRVVQICVDWHDEATGVIVPFKCLIDLIQPFDNSTDEGKSIADLKTARSAELRDWTRAVWNEGYFYQAAVYLAATRAVTGNDYRMFKHVILENDAPYEPADRFLSHEFIQLGMDAFDHDMRLYCQCLKENKWPGYDSKWVDPESWMLNGI